MLGVVSIFFLNVLFICGLYYFNKQLLGDKQSDTWKIGRSIQLLFIVNLVGGALLMTAVNSLGYSGADLLSQFIAGFIFITLVGSSSVWGLIVYNRDKINSVMPAALNERLYYLSVSELEEFNHSLGLLKEAKDVKKGKKSKGFQHLMVG